MIMGLINLKKGDRKVDVEMSRATEVESIDSLVSRENGLERLISTKKVGCGLRGT